MITSLHLRNFKRFESLDVSEFTKVNLLAGKNNCGKTGLLEALQLACSDDEPKKVATSFRLTEGVDELARIDQWFGHEGLPKWLVAARDPTPWKPIYFRASHLDDNDVDLLSGWAGSRDSDRGALNLGGGLGNFSGGAIPLNVKTVPSWPLRPSEEASEFEKMILRDDTEEKLEDLLRKVEPRIKSVRSLQPNSHRVLFAQLDFGRRIPLSLLGQGVMKLTSIFTRCLGAKADILLIDEIENGLHHGALIELWKGLKELSDKEGTQIFATTHSMECIAAASQVFGAGPDAGLSFHRIEDVKGVPTAISIDAARLASMLEIGFEIR